MTLMPPTTVPPEGIGAARAAALAEISRLHRRAARGIYPLALFLLVSIGAVRGFSFIPPLSERAWQILGAPPPITLISAFLVIYLFSAIVLTLGRMAGGSEKYGGMSHLGYLTAFYIFLYFAGGLDESFWAVFAGGLTILGLEAFQIWNQCTEEIRREKALLAELKKKEKDRDGAAK